MSTFVPHGVYAASLTPLNADLTPDLGRMVAHSRWLLANGCDGLGILGTTGEANSLTVADRRRVIEQAARDLPPERLMPGIGSCALADAVDLAKAALAVGAVNVLCLPPFYYKPASEAGVEAFFAQLIERVNDDRLRLYLYHFPQLTGFHFTVPMVERLRQRFGKIIAGMKDSSGVLDNMLAFAKAIPDFGVFPGSEQFMLEVMAAGGGVGCISATTNLTAAVAQVAYRSRAATDQARATAIRLALQSKPLIPILRGLFAHYSGDLAWNRMLPPNLALPAADVDAMVAQLTALAFQPDIPRA